MFMIVDLTCLSILTSPGGFMTYLRILSQSSLPVKGIFCVLALLAGCTCTPQHDSKAPQESKGDAKAEKEPLTIEELNIGTGPEAVVGDLVKVHYEGRFPDGQVFNRSYDRNEPFVFILGRNQVIKGWDLGLLGMQAGGKRRLTLDPSIAYGDRGAGATIPPGATLVFEVEMIEIHADGGRSPAPKTPTVTSQDQ
jgi:hypothetical protein